MDKYKTQNILYAGIAATSIYLLLKNYKKQKNTYWIYKDHDIRNSVEVDHRESPNAAYDDAEIGLSELDATYRAEWTSMGYPLTNRELEENENKYS
ncbi:hypothetical protein [Planomicrobium sp. CPCC 101079]|uniref:hypothetical protein n=1 Tax=Planomicrobium sp. CPCC 101079 TaxID=2599618 RepID=UPI0011B35860|nr:hypothetical protein [Planomicrobium sp. CPCC 101079]TWT14571.1 hypothetical protein FQV28_01100 [Planomicrobium sp. CPCC 101079]